MDRSNHLGQLHALWTLEGMGAIDANTIIDENNQDGRGCRQLQLFVWGGRWKQVEKSNQKVIWWSSYDAGAELPFAACLE